MLENCNKIMHLRFSFDAFPMYSPFGFVHDASKSERACIFCHNSLAKVNTQLLIYDYGICVNGLICCRKIMCTYDRSGAAWSTLRARSARVSGTGEASVKVFFFFFFFF